MFFSDLFRFQTGFFFGTVFHSFRSFFCSFEVDEPSTQPLNFGVIFRNVEDSKGLCSDEMTTCWRIINLKRRQMNSVGFTVATETVLAVHDMHAWCANGSLSLTANVSLSI